jgi:hypothetical protein
MLIRHAVEELIMKCREIEVENEHMAGEDDVNEGDPSILRFLLASRDESADLERLQELLETLVPLLVKSVKDPRSDVCKTALMTCTDIFKANGDLMVNSIDPLLVQLILTASQDKCFVCEVATAALTSLTSWIFPLLLKPIMLPYLKNKNPGIRPKASRCVSVLLLMSQGNFFVMIWDPGGDARSSLRASYISRRGEC